HTLNCNTDSIGISMACMAGAIEGGSFGSYPMTEKQFEAMCERISMLCTAYGIPVSRTTVLSHAEVQGTLGIQQRNKWDFTVLPYKPTWKGALPCGAYVRERVNSYTTGNLTAKPNTNTVPSPPATTYTPEPVSEPQPFSLWRWLLSLFGV